MRQTKTHSGFTLAEPMAGLDGTRPGRPRHAGFTLAELMVALGILAVGVAMIGTAFPSAILENKDSMDEMMGALIAENATAIIRLRLRHGRDDTPAMDAMMDLRLDKGLVMVEQSGLIPLGERTYPSQGDPAGSRLGWVMAVRRTGLDVNDYQFIIVPFRKLSPSDPAASVAFSSVTIHYDQTKKRNTVLAGNVVVGAPVIRADNGKYSFIRAKDGTDYVLGTVLNDTGTDQPGLIVGDSLARGGGTPAIGCFPLRISLPP